MPSVIWSVRSKDVATSIDAARPRACGIPYGSVKVSTGILKQDKRGVLSNHVKGLNFKIKR